MKKMIIFLVLIIAAIISIFMIQQIRTEKDEEAVYDWDKRRANPYPSLKFVLDCSRLSDEYQKDCQTFLYNQEHILYPEMKRITGVDLRWCYDTINMTIYPRGDEAFPCSGGGGCIGHEPEESTIHIAYLPQISIHEKCKMDSHELQHVLDSCVSGFYLPEVMTVAGGIAEKNLCPEYEFPYNLNSLMRDEIVEDDTFVVKDCLTAQAYTIYNADEEFIHKFYESLLEKPLGFKKESDITEAIIYASDNEPNHYMKEYCLKR